MQLPEDFLAFSFELTNTHLFQQQKLIDDMTSLWCIFIGSVFQWRRQQLKFGAVAPSHPSPLPFPSLPVSFPAAKRPP